MRRSLQSMEKVEEEMWMAGSLAGPGSSLAGPATGIARAVASVEQFNVVLYE